MAYPKGAPKPKGSGRKVGTPNKRTLAEDACHKLGISPFEMLVKMATEGESEQTRLTAITTLCKHIEPPRKALDVAIDPEQNVIKVIIERYGNKD